jgi:hypothetical protein
MGPRGSIPGPGPGRDPQELGRWKVVSEELGQVLVVFRGKWLVQGSSSPSRWDSFRPTGGIPPVACRKASLRGIFRGILRGGQRNSQRASSEDLQRNSEKVRGTSRGPPQRDLQRRSEELGQFSEKSSLRRVISRESHQFSEGNGCLWVGSEHFGSFSEGFDHFSEDLAESQSRVPV